MGRARARVRSLPKRVRAHVKLIVEPTACQMLGSHQDWSCKSECMSKYLISVVPHCFPGCQKTLLLYSEGSLKQGCKSISGRVKQLPWRNRLV